MANLEEGWNLDDLWREMRWKGTEAEERHDISPERLHSRRKLSVPVNCTAYNTNDLLNLIFVAAELIRKTGNSSHIRYLDYYFVESNPGVTQFYFRYYSPSKVTHEDLPRPWNPNNEESTARSAFVQYRRYAPGVIKIPDPGLFPPGALTERILENHEKGGILFPDMVKKAFEAHMIGIVKPIPSSFKRKSGMETMSTLAFNKVPRQVSEQVIYRIIDIILHETGGGFLWDRDRRKEITEYLGERPLALRFNKKPPCNLELDKSIVNSLLMRKEITVGNKTESAKSDLSWRETCQKRAEQEVVAAKKRLSDAKNRAEFFARILDQQTNGGEDEDN